MAALSLGGWVTAAVLMANRGLDLTDESFYLLSYRWWDSNPRTFSGVQYLYGPVYELLGYDVARLRLVRLVTLVAAHGYFAWAFLSWLRSAGGRDALPGPRPWAWWLALTSVGAASYGWLPASPGYNDVALISSLVVAAAVLRVSECAGQARAPIVALLLAGAFVGIGALAKWSSALAVTALAMVVVLIALRRASRRFVLMAVASAVAGFVLWAVLFGLLVQPWPDVLGPMRETNALVSQQTNAPSALLGMYLSTSLEVLLAVLLAVGLAAWPVAIGLFLKRPIPAAPVLVSLVGVAAAVPWLAVATPPAGGAANALVYSSSLLSCLIATGVFVTLLRRQARSEPPGTEVPEAPAPVWHIRLLLLGLPLAQAFGTGNSLYLLAINGLVAWTALLVAVSVRTDLSAAGSVLNGGLATCSALVAVVAVTATLLHPYRSASFAEASTPLGTEALTGLRVSADEAAQATAIVAALRNELKPGQAVLALDELAGYVLLLDHPPAGEAWTSALDHDRTAAGLAAYCKASGSTPPVVLANRPVAVSETEALRECGVDFASGYSAIAIPGAPAEIRVYAPQG